MSSIATPAVPVRRVRIAIASPGMLAHIRQLFAERNLAVDFVSPPSIEVTVRAVTGGPPRGGPALDTRLHAEYRLHVVNVDTATAPDNVIAAIPLSLRQRQVMALVSAGVRNGDIAARLGVSEKTVKNHINHIFRTMGVASRVEAVLLWQRSRGVGATHPVAGQWPAVPGTP